MPASRLLLLGAVACALPGCATAAAPNNPLVEFQRREARLFDTGWHLARANRAFCRRTENSVGLLLHDAANYGKPESVRQTFGLAGDIGVQAVATGSPAARADILPNSTVFAIDQRRIETFWPPTDPGVERTLQLESAIADSLEDGKVGLAFTNRGDETVLAGERLCAAKFRLTSGDDAYSGPDTVFFGADFMAFGVSKDVFAAALAHELAHVLLDHPARKQAEKWGWQETRASERIADRMMPWLLFNGGYDPAAAQEWMRAWGPRHSGGLLRKRTHDGWDERLAMITAETARLRSLVASHDWQAGEADWSAYLAREGN